MPTTRWGDAITRLLAERGWNKRQLAEAASVRPNTLTNLIRHAKDSDTATLTRIAAAFNVDIAELFLTREQSVVLQAYRESRVDRVKELVVRELSETVTRIVTQELQRSEGFSEAVLEPLRAEHSAAKKPRRKRLRPTR